MKREEMSDRDKTTMDNIKNYFISNIIGTSMHYDEANYLKMSRMLKPKPNYIPRDIFRVAMK